MKESDLIHLFELEIVLDDLREAREWLRREQLKATENCLYRAQLLLWLVYPSLRPEKWRDG
jgi:hypothetical protein